MKTNKILIPLLLTILFSTCITLNETKENNPKSWQPEYRFQAGINHGGIIENTDMSEIENAGVDACSGATKIGANVGAHILLPVRKNNFELGVDYMFSNQTFNYNDNLNNYFGERKITTSQILFPITYNIGLLRRKYEEGLFQLKFGYVFQYNFCSTSDNGTNLPDYKTINFSSGPTFGIASTPFTLGNGNKIGFFLDLYRGTQIYEDFYNQSSFEMPGSSYFKAGIIYHLIAK